MLHLNKTQTFNYFWEMEKVGTHNYVVTKSSEELFSMTSTTEVTNENKTLLLEGIFVFNHTIKPESYELFVEQDGDTTQIIVEFSETNVTSRVKVGEETVVISNALPKNSFLAENNMPGFWEILLSSADLDRGRRYRAYVYIPQGGDIFELEFFVHNELKTVRIGDQFLDCLVISESTLEMSFYFNDNMLVQMRNEDQDTLLEKKLD